MSQILSFNSRLVFGHVGGEGSAFVLRRLGHEVWQVPTVLYSNHPGHGGFAGQALPAAQLADLVAGAETRSVLKNVTAIHSGYLGTADQAEVIAGTVARSRRDRTDLLYLCDPVLGDRDQLYVGEDIAVAMKEVLVPLATVITPNRFELSYLSGRGLNSLADCVVAARHLISMGPKAVLCTSAEETETEISTLLVAKDTAYRITQPRLHKVPHGTGDVFAAMMLGHLLLANTDPINSIVDACERSTASLAGILSADDQKIPGELPLVAAQDQIIQPSFTFAAERLDL